MKKSIIIIVAICIANFVFAQDVKNTPQNSIGVRVGTLTAFQNHDAFTTWLANPFSQGLMGKKRQSSPTFQYGASYGFDVSKKVTISVIGAYQEIKGYGVENTYSNEGNPIGTRKFDLSAEKQTSIVGKIDFNFVNNENIILYSGIGAGVGIYEGEFFLNSDLNEKYQRPVFHITALGIKTKGKVSFFGELGVGALGILNVGMNVRF